MAIVLVSSILKGRFVIIGKSPRNVIYFHTHDTGRMVDPYGFAIGTPHLGSFARAGMLFRNAFSAAPTCSPSRAGLLTGQCSHSSGMLGLAHRGFCLTDPGQHIVRTLGSAGYESAMVGVQHLVNGNNEAQVLGYDEHLELDDRRAASVAARASEYIKRSHDAPYFLSVGLYETHVFPPHSEYLFGYPPVEAGYVCRPQLLPDTPETRSDVASFIPAVRQVDDALGVCLGAVEESGAAGDTLIIVTTDHGIPLPGMKCTLSDFGTGVMLLMRGPGIPAGYVNDKLVSQIDIFPTLCDLLGLEKPPWLQGTSVGPTWESDVEVNAAVFSEVTFHAAYEPQRAIRTGRWKYIRRFGDFGGPVLANVDDTGSKDLLIEAGWRCHRPDSEVLFDLTFDPNERTNLAASSGHSAVRENLSRELYDWMARTNDPLLGGPVAPPPGARLAQLSDLSARTSRP